MLELRKLSHIEMKLKMKLVIILLFFFFSIGFLSKLIVLEQVIAQIQKKLTDAFDVFDGDKTRTVDVK